MLDETAKIANVEISIKKYMIDNLETAEGLELSFDVALNDPNLFDKDIDQWVIVKSGAVKRKGLSEFLLKIVCATRKDPEGVALSTLSDTVISYLAGSDGGQKKTIPFLIAGDPPAAMNPSQVLIVNEVQESEKIDAGDGSNFKILTCVIKWVAR